MSPEAGLADRQFNRAEMVRETCAFIGHICDVHYDLVSALKVASGYVSDRLGRAQVDGVAGTDLDRILADYETVVSALAKAEARPAP